MYRHVDDYLSQWKESKYRKPLVIQGARQVGKTYAIPEFGHKHYDNVAYFDFYNSTSSTWANGRAAAFRASSTSGSSRAGANRPSRRPTPRIARR